VKLPSKILAVAADPHDHASVYVAEAAGTVKRINPEVGQTTAVARHYHKSQLELDANCRCAG